MHPLALAQLVALVAVANATPVAAKKLLGNRFAWPLDGGANFLDGRPLFGRSKTVRGILLSVLLTAGAASLLGLGAKLGAIAGAAAMAGDLFSSFCKRRLALAPSSRATGLDQIPESLFPLLVCRAALSLTLLDITVGVGVFTVGEMVGSRLLYRWHLRDRPY
jgi:CDP-2,3-bis-(O-geranylgeranyl)-sn-glycerol synthase